MNYRHQFHAGNFADVMKHALLVQLVRALQKKERGFLCLDTHAGRGGYELAAAARGDSLARKPEWPDGIGRLCGCPGLPPALDDYLSLLHAFDARMTGPAPAGGPAGGPPRFYPGSPWLLRLLARPQERIVLCELQPDESLALHAAFRGVPRLSVRETDGFAALRALLPPPEQRGLVLIDPPFEAQDEWRRIVEALGQALGRFPSGVFAIWYPLTQRARVDAFFAELRTLPLPPTLALELAIAAGSGALKMKGCGLVVLNPPWTFERTAEPMLHTLAGILAQEPGGGARATWLVPE